MLFSPTSDATTTTSYLSVQEAQPTPGRSRLSDIGSLDTIGRSDANSESWGPPGHRQPTSGDVAEDDAELDSLDGHLPEFRSIPSPYNSGKGQDTTSYPAPVLPGHDGLGSFRLHTRGEGSELQEQLYAFEKFNPKRVKRRHEDLDLAQLEADRSETQESERNRRIEAWQLEQSRYLLDRVQKETRARRKSEASARNPLSGKNAADELASLHAVGEVHTGGDDWHDQDATDLPDAQEGIWSRITRTMIRDLIGIDDRLLSILFGEAPLPDDQDLSSTPKASSPIAAPTAPASASCTAESQDDSSWHLRVLDRVARELGLLVHRLSNHPGAFSTYMRMQQAPIPYAGLPVIPESTVDTTDSQTRPTEESTPFMPRFYPTVKNQARPISIPGAQSSANKADSVPSATDGNSNGYGPTFTQQEWEQDLDISLVFRYVRSRFTSDPPQSSSNPLSGSDTSHLATSSTQDVAAKAARVRQHHPLVSRAHTLQRPRPADRRSFKAAGPVVGPVLRHPSGSCASQSTRRSARRSSMSSRQSSRHFWDIGGSIGTGSMVGSTGPMGSWGEA